MATEGTAKKLAVHKAAAIIKPELKVFMTDPRLQLPRHSCWPSGANLVQFLRFDVLDRDDARPVPSILAFGAVGKEKMGGK